MARSHPLGGFGTMIVCQITKGRFFLYGRNALFIWPAMSGYELW